MNLQPLIDELVVAQREFSTAEREKLTKSGAALPDGSYPITDTASLKDAISAYGRAKDKATAKAHIKKRARALGHEDLIPDNWDGSTDGDQVQQEAENEEPVQQNGVFGGFMGFLRKIYETDQTVTQDGIGIPSGDESAAQPEVGIKNPQTALGKRRKRKDEELEDEVEDETVLTKHRVTQEVPILQIDTLKRVVTGVVQTPDVEVRPASMPGKILIYPKGTVQQMAWGFMKNYHNGSIGLRHGEVQQGQIVPQNGEHATVVESYLAPIDLTFPNGKLVKQGTWIMSVQINNDGAWEDVQRGDLRAFSLASTKVKFSSPL